jgi:hypothetical protein
VTVDHRCPRKALPVLPAKSLESRLQQAALCAPHWATAALPRVCEVLTVFPIASIVLQN